MSKQGRVVQGAESLLVKTVVGLLSALPIEVASRLGGAVAACFGPLLPVSRKVGDANLRMAMPELSKAERRHVIHQVWKNLGQTIAELADIKAMKERPVGSRLPGYSLQGWEEHALPFLEPGKPAIFFTGHLANWEVMPIIAASRGLDFGFMYRAASNPLVDEVLKNLRRSGYEGKVKMFPKGASGAKAAYAHLSRGGVLGLLVDQKLDTGLPVPFFGKTAMTMDALASFALRFRCPVLPIHAKRLGPGRLMAVCDKPLRLPQTGDKQADILALTSDMNQTLERWIKEQPGDWLWLHRRWPRQINSPTH